MAETGLGWDGKRGCAPVFLGSLWSNFVLLGTIHGSRDSISQCGRLEVIPTLETTSTHAPFIFLGILSVWQIIAGNWQCFGLWQCFVVSLVFREGSWHSFRLCLNRAPQFKHIIMLSSSGPAFFRMQFEMSSASLVINISPLNAFADG